MEEPPRTSGNHGGTRKVLSWEQKLELLEDDIIVAFVDTATCGCKLNCMQKIRDLQHDGVGMVHELRGARLAGLCFHNPCCTTPNRHESIASYRLILNCHLR